MLEVKIIPSVEKVFLDDKFSTLPEINSGYIYRNGSFSFQLAVTDCAPGAPHRRFLPITLNGVGEDSVCLRTVEHIPSYMPSYPGLSDPDYLRTEPGLFPDLLSPLQMRGKIPVVRSTVRTVWVDIYESDALLSVGENHLTITVGEGEDCVSLDFCLILIDAALPEVDFCVTQWFHYDCLAEYYGVEVFSDRHFEIIEAFLRTYVKNGGNTILTPLFTPPLDTYIGGERETVQLVGVTLEEDGGYSFDFSLLSRFIDMCEGLSIKKYEMSHLFTQWGALHAPKIMASTKDGYRKIFGWESESTGEQYRDFLCAFIPRLLAFLKERGIAHRCIFHISDEPHRDQLDGYRAARDIVAEMLCDFTVTDALSNIEFYEMGIVTSPIPATTSIEPFIEAYARQGRRGLWTYYCCGQNVGVSNRYFAMSGARTRFIGVQFYRYELGGFLQWGYNFYHNQNSYDRINPYCESTGNYFVPSGDAFSVYPAPDGTAYESIRINHFREGLEDMRALYLAESLLGRDAVVELIEGIVKKVTGHSIVFSKCINGSLDMLRLRRAVDELIQSKLEK